MHSLVRLSVVAVVLVLACAASVQASIRPPSARAAAVFPRVVREDLVERLAAKVVPVLEIEPLRVSVPGCCFDATPDSTCRVDDGDAMCLADAGDGCGPAFVADREAPPYWPETVPVVAESGSRWGEVSRAEQRRSIREILRVLAERQPAKAVGIAAYAVGYVESGFNPTAMHPKTKACGLYQFLSGTWRDFARADVADDPDACHDARENAAAAITFLTHLYETHFQTIVDQTPEWATMTEWERLTAVFVGLYSLHNYGENDPRWLDAENGARQIAMAHVGVLKDFYDTLNAEAVRLAAGRRPVGGGKRRRG
jgi:hypothetical protein